MNVVTASLLLITGLIILWKAAELLVSGAVGISNRFGLSQLVIGLTVVAMGTSTPEVAASIAAAVRDSGNVALGNVYGSNIANLALVGGLCAIIAPITINKKLLLREIPVMIVVALMLLPILAKNFLSRFDAIVLLAIFISLIVMVVIKARKGINIVPPAVEHTPTKSKPFKICILFVIAGLAGLALGAEFTVRAAVFIGREIGLSEAVIGLTIVAVGTSLPELVTCLVAAIKGHNDITVGNLVGSNIFNTLLVTGVAGLTKPFVIEQRLATVDFWIMVTVSAIFFAMALIQKQISRACGAILFIGYAAYLTYLLTSA